MSDWFSTVSGRRLYVEEPDPGMIVIGDVAHALAKKTRYGGHTVGDDLYSVAQHAVLVSIAVERELPRDTETSLARKIILGALHHDTDEYALDDLRSPVKNTLGETYKRLEARWHAAIATSFGCVFDWEKIKVQDYRALLTERRDLLPFSDPMRYKHAPKWSVDELGLEPWPEKIVPWSIRESRERFLSRFYDLGGAKEAA